MPVQLATWNSTGAGGRAPTVPQQMRALPVVQSRSELHDFGQVDWQMPPQQRGVLSVPLHSESDVHALGHEVAPRQMEVCTRDGSSPAAVLQHTSPDAVLQSVPDPHFSGQLAACVQIGVE